MPETPPAVPPGPGAAMVAWARTPRRDDAPGIYTYGHTPRPPADPDRIPDRRLVGQAVGALIGGWFAYSISDNYLGWLWLKPLEWLGYAPAGPWTDAQTHRFVIAADAYTVLWWVLLAAGCARAGHWPEAARRYLLPALRRAFPRPGPDRTAADPAVDPAAWPDLRAAGRHEAADRLAAELAAGRMTDVDHVRLTRAWTTASTSPAPADAYVRAILERGAAAWPHPSGARGLPARVARHDLMAAQVRLGTVVDTDRNPARHRGAGVAVDPTVLGTSLAVVGPSGAGKTRHLVRPIAESLCLQALAGGAAMVTVGTRGTHLGPAEAFDVVIACGDPESAHGLDLYAGTADPDVAALLLSAALLDGSEDERAPQRATAALSQILGPFRAAHGRFPSVPELRELLDGDPTAVATLRTLLDEAGEPGWVRELDIRTRQSARAGDIGVLLADRIAPLDRPAFAGFFDTTDHTTGRTRPFALTPARLEIPLRIRVDLPDHGHTQASRILTRLLLAQFTTAAAGRQDRALFAGLILDDATHAITAESVRAVQQLRSAHAGAVLALRGLADVPQALRGPLLGAVGCRIALAGISTWDAMLFAQSWGTAWVEDTDITRTPDLSGGITKRLTRGIRQLVTGEAATTEAVTVHRVERDRWSASDLAHAVPWRAD